MIVINPLDRCKILAVYSKAIAKIVMKYRKRWYNRGHIDSRRRKSGLRRQLDYKDSSILRVFNSVNVVFAVAVLV